MALHCLGILHETVEEDNVKIQESIKFIVHYLQFCTHNTAKKEHIFAKKVT